MCSLASQCSWASRRSKQALPPCVLHPTSPRPARAPCLHAGQPYGLQVTGSGLCSHRAMLGAACNSRARSASAAKECMRRGRRGCVSESAVCARARHRCCSRWRLRRLQSGTTQCRPSLRCVLPFTLRITLYPAHKELWFRDGGQGSLAYCCVNLSFPLHVVGGYESCAGYLSSVANLFWPAVP